MRGDETPENHLLTILKGFSTVSVEICNIRGNYVRDDYEEGVNKITRAFESFIDLGGPIHDQMIRNKKKQKMIAIIRAIKFKT